MSTRLFGTDGIRGTANEEPMTADTMLRLGRAAACVFRKNQKDRHHVLIGKDTRLSGYMFEMAFASGLCSMGVDVLLVGPLPTPGVAFLTGQMRADAGAVISASHNLFEDNGIKLFGPDGFKLSDELEKKIEHICAHETLLDEYRPASGKIGKTKRVDDARGRYISHLKYHFPKELSLDGMKIVVDCAHGATYRIAPVILSELGAQVIPIGVSPDGTNINQDCGAVSTEHMGERVREHGADLGVAYDGDGDRLMMCDESGFLFDGDDILATLIQSNQEISSRGVVGTLMTNLGLERYCQDRKIPFYRASVGDRHVVEMMKSEGCLIGGESSGHVIYLPAASTGDGILTSLLVLAELTRSGQPMSEFMKVFSHFPQRMKNVVVKKKKPLYENKKISSVIKEAESALGKRGRILVRYSGTEPKARIMVEAEEMPLVDRWVEDVASVIESELGGQELLKLGVNIDHVATLREARKIDYPDPVEAAKLAFKAGADNITCHLREDRRHVQDKDVFDLKAALELPLNFEMAATPEMLEIALKLTPHTVTVVPEKREELTTEGGLLFDSNDRFLNRLVESLSKKKIEVSLFVEADINVIDEAKQLGVSSVELHTGSYAEKRGVLKEKELERINHVAAYAKGIGVSVHIGHGLNLSNLEPFRGHPDIESAQIGHAIVGHSIFVGLERAVGEYRQALLP